MLACKCSEERGAGRGCFQAWVLLSPGGEGPAGTWVRGLSTPSSPPVTGSS